MDPITVILLAVSVAAFIMGIIGFFLPDRKEEARKKYQNALSQLKRDPNNPDLREETLHLGREYSNLARDRQGHTLFDEMALMNDINAACARATVGQHAVGKVEVTNVHSLRGKSVAQEIEKLGQIFLQGIITADEFEQGKAVFLGAPPDKAATAVELLQNLNVLKVKGVLSESEFNMKKWEILSERLIPGNRQAATLQPHRSVGQTVPPPGPSPQSIPCPTCRKGIPEGMIMPGLNTCPHCKTTYEAED